jgi:6-phosphofructokinase 1
MAKKIGVLTSGTDSPGLNAAIRAVVLRAIRHYGMEVVGVLRGWRGLMDGLFSPLDERSVTGIVGRGGTILRISRTNPFRDPAAVSTMKEHVRAEGLQGLVVIGGAKSLAVAARLYREEGLEVVGIPKTIDNDVQGTDFSFGFNTAINVAMEAIDRVHTTAESHDRVMVVEVMGRQSGWIALYAGIAGGADLILAPEHPVDLQEVCQTIIDIHERGRDFTIVVVAEGAHVLKEDRTEEPRVRQDTGLDEFDEARLGGIGEVLGREIETRTGYETRVTKLGHIQRGGAPTAFDRVLATRFGIAAVDLVHKGVFGRLVALRGGHVTDVDLALPASGVKTVSEELYEAAKALFG